VTCWLQQDNRLYQTADGDTSSGQVVGAVVSLDDASGQEQAMAALGSVEWVLVTTTSSTTTTTSSSSSTTTRTKSDDDDDDWQMIPAENLIAAAASSGTKVAFSVDKVSDVGGLARALELGVDALCISANAAQTNTELWNAVFEARKERNEKAITKEDAIQQKEDTVPTITIGSCWRRATKGTVLADRVCVDLVQNLLPEEGCWIGSSAKIMALILSEAASSQYVPTRPFRVNAGPVHSYILLADDSTKYLSELEAADQVAVFNAVTGKSRSVTVGRLKQEVRPCVLVELESSSKKKSSSTTTSTNTLKGQVFLQQAETVRLGQEDGGFVRVTELEAQARKESETKQIWLRVMTTGTHIGTAYAGKVEER
jgi:3-dehydroquinate synthase II